ncbi:MAG: hypothetical protein IT254_04300 [Chitinophagaceae bacterium]|nr:hypothetical protein [Bacteroidota bacterium]MCC6257519.1 hypothetical protein [Chitinophagaceae bacterium]
MIVSVYSNVSTGQSQLTGNARNVQNNNIVPQITPPSPNTVALEKFGNLPIDYSTGTSPVSMSFCQWKHGNLSLSVSLNYHTGGIKIDDMASYVGLGWALSAGGSVNRTVRGIPDDDHARGFWFTPNLPFAETYAYNPDEYYYTDPWLASTGGDFGYSQVINYSNDKPYQSYQIIEDIDTHFLDGEQDFFSYSCGTLSGQFVIDKNREVKMLKQTNDIISLNWQDSILLGFRITDQMGIKYYFSHVELQLPQLYADPLSIHLPPNYAYASSWYVTSITDPVTADSIKIEYADNNSNEVSYETGFSESATYSIKAGIPETLEAPSIGTSYTRISGNDVTVKKILFPDSTNISFKYVQDRDDYYLAKRLCQITLSNMYLDTIKKWKLISGYFESPAMVTTVPASSQNNNFKRLKLTSINETDALDSVKTTRFVYDTIPLNPRGTFNQDIWGYNVNPTRNNNQRIPTIPFEAVDYGLNGNDKQYFRGADRDPDSLYCTAGSLKRIVYPTGGFTEFEYECNRAFNDTFFFENSRKYTGLTWDSTTFNHFKSFSVPDRVNEGIRFLIKANEYSERPEHDPNAQQSCFGNQDLGLVHFKIYSALDTSVHSEFDLLYSDLLAGVEYFDSISVSTAGLFIELDYNKAGSCLWEYPFEVTLDYSYQTPKHEKLVGGLRIKKIKDFDGQKYSSIRSFTYDGSIDKNSGDLFLFPTHSYYRSSLDESIIGNWCGVPTSVGPNKRILHLSSNPTNSVNYFNGCPLVYKQVIETDLYGGTTVRTYDPINWKATGGSTDRMPGIPIQDFPTLSGLILSEKIYDSADALKQESRYHYKKDLSQFINVDACRNLKTLLISSSEGTENNTCNYDQKFYLAYQYFMWKANCNLISKVSNRYEGNLVFADSTSYEYDPVYNLPVQTRFSNSRGDTFKISTQYVTDYSYHPYSDLKALNRLAIPISTSKTIDPPIPDDPASQISQKEFDFFDDRPLLKTISSAIQNATPEVVTEIQRYDSRGNVLQYKEKNGPTAVILWGYHKQYPVAIIKGVTLDEISGLIDYTILENPPNNEGFHDYLFSLRNALQTYNADCHFYTYKPMVGISSEIDNSGKSAFYQYDSFNQLKAIIDEDGHVVNAFENHYNQ